VVQKNGLALEYVPEAQKTEAVCLDAVRQNGWVLQYVPESLKPKIKAALGKEKSNDK